MSFNQTPMPGGLPACKQYINFKLAPKANGKTDKLPIDLVGNVIDPHNPQFWQDAGTCWASVHNQRGVGWIVSAGWFVIDLDNCLVNGAWSALAVELCQAFAGAYIDVTPSGQGLRIIGRGTLPDGHRCRFDGGEVYTLRRFVTITGTGAQGNANTDFQHIMPWLLTRLGLTPEVLAPITGGERDPLCRSPEDDDALIALMLAEPRRSAQAVFGANVADIWAMNETALIAAFGVGERSDGLPYDHSSVDMAMMNHLAYYTGHEHERMQRLFQRWTGYREWKYTRSRGYHMNRAISKAGSKGRVYGDKTSLALGVAAPDAAAVVAVEGAAQPASMVGLFYAFPEERTCYHRQSKTFWPMASVDDIYPPVIVGVNAGGMEKPMKASRYIAKNFAVHQVSWWPGEPEIIANTLIRNGERLLSPGMMVLNTYEAPAPTAGNPNDVKPWLDHIARLYPNDWGTIVRWMAFVAQNGGVKVNWAVVLGGAMRIGKDTIIAPLKRAVGGANFETVDPEDIMTGPYNDYLKTRVLVINEAKDLGGESRFAFYEKTKPIIAAPPAVHRINPKYGRKSVIPNLNATIIMTNHLTGGLYVPADDGRHAVFWSDARRGHAGLDDAYFDGLWAWLDAGGLENCAAYLLAINVQDFKPKGMPPRTPAFYAMMEGSRSDEQNDLVDLLKFMDDKPFSILQLSSTARMNGMPELGDWLVKKNPRGVNHALLENGCQKHENPDERRGRWLVLGKQTVLYRLATN